ncbi:MAG: 50S ribosomal protein L4 [Candidatus Aminicenantes bacterium]|nr:50S ribosomal protein L4 [Candidatus Aminicenantes bacterium]
MLKLNVRNLNNEEVSKVEVPEEVFDYPLREHLVYEAVKNFRANQRSGNAATKTRGNISGSGKKLWKQKGTGRARVGTIKSPLWRSGGITFGPQPRDYSYTMPKKARRNALKSVLSEKVRNDKLFVIDKIDVNSNKTKETLNQLQKFDFEKMLIVDNRDNSNLMLSTRNLKNVKSIDFSEINVYDTLKYTHIMLSVDALNGILEVLK